MRLRAFEIRVAKELVRDPITLFFGLGFPIILLVLLSAIQANIPQPVFSISSLAPGVTVFGLSFMSLFSAFLVSKDRESAFLIRLYTTPLTSADFIFGYILPMLPMAVIQTAITYIFALFLGLKANLTLLLAVFLNILAALLFISLGLIAGSVLTSKQVGGICGALLTNLTAWLSGVWFDVALVGGAFEGLANALPFLHAVELARAVYAGNFSDIFPHLWWVLGYTLAATALAVLFFTRQMKKQ